MSHRTVSGLFVALVASSSLSPEAAPPAPPAVEVSLLSVSPGSPTGVDDWCIGAGRTIVTAHVVDVASQSEVTEGWIAWQVCSGSTGGFPKEACDAAPTHGPPGATRWVAEQLSDLSVDSAPSIAPDPAVPVLGFRLQYQLKLRGGPPTQRVTSVPFNLDTTCSP